MYRDTRTYTAGYIPVTPYKRLDLPGPGDFDDDDYTYEEYAEEDDYNEDIDDRDEYSTAVKEDWDVEDRF